MLDGMTPQEFDEWMAVDQIDPIDNRRLFSIMANGFATICTAWGIETEPSAFVPNPDAESKEETLSPAAAASMFPGRTGA